MWERPLRRDRRKRIAAKKSFRTSIMNRDAFTEFEHRGWQRVADKYDSTFATSTRQFIPFLLDAARVAEKMCVLDVGCGPGYISCAVAGRRANPIGLDFSGEMVAIARQKFPGIDFREGNAQNLPFADFTFDRVLASFALLHLPDPERGCAQACRVLKPGGRFAFTTWARKEENVFLQLVDDAVRAHADLAVALPPGPPYYLFENEEEFRKALERAGFDGATMEFNRRTTEWHVPTAR